MLIRWQDKELTLPPGTSVRDCLAALGISEGALAAMRGGQVLELNETLREDSELNPITLRHEEGRRIYERCLRMMMLLAVRRLYPGEQVRIEYSAGHGVFVRLPRLSLSEGMVAEIEQEMRRIADAGLPFEKRCWALEDAIAYFEAEGQQDKVELLHYRPFPYFNMYRLGNLWDYFYGAMTPSTAWVRVFQLHYHAPGFVLLMPDKADPSKPAAYVDMPKHLAVFAQSAAWCEILGVVNAADVGQLMVSGNMREFIRVNEALHDKAIAAIADKIVAAGKRIILIAGPSSSGKTTFAQRLRVHLKVLGRHPLQLSMDDYYLDRDTLPREADGSLDLESIHTLDLPRLQQDICRLLEGEEVETPMFNFTTGKREAQGTANRLEPGQPLIIKGIHGLNPLLAQGLPQEQIHRIFVSALTCVNLDDHNRIRTTDVRLLRRIVRDSATRGTPARGTLAMWDSVRRGEDTWIFPYQEQADSMFNTALHYELPILKHFAYDALKAIGPEDPTYLKSRRLLKTLHYFPSLDPALLTEIPPLSLEREFIGGCTFYEK